MPKLSVNINKIATIRNARGGNIPNVQKAAIDIQKFGAEGITVHPRPDQRHITYQDVRLLKPLVYTEFNIEGYPNEDFLNLVFEVQPQQVTFVPDPPNVLTSNAGWDTIAHFQLLKEVTDECKKRNIRVSFFIENNLKFIESAKKAGADRIELYTEEYAKKYTEDKKAAIHPYLESANYAKKIGLGVNAGHDLNLENLRFFIETIPFIDEVSIGHALISDALYYGLQNIVPMYKGKMIL